MTSRLAALLSLFIAAIICYSAAINNELIYDDHEVIQANRGPGNLAETVRLFQERHFPNLPYYRPITRTSLLLQKSWTGEDPAPFHLFNAALAGVAGVLAFLLLSSPAFALRRWQAWTGAALFILHPIASSCVYPVSSGRETMMPAVWTLACVYCWLRGWHWGALGAFAGALLSKEQAVVIPVLLVLADALGLSGDSPKQLGQWVRRYGPLAAVMAVYFAIRHALFGSSEYGGGSLSGPFLAILYALQTIFAPFIELHYEPRLPVWFSWPRLAIAALCVAALIYAHRATRRSYLLFWCGWFLIALLPTANVVRQEAPFDERYVFLASLGIWALIAALVPYKPLAIGVVVFAVGTISFLRAGYFRDDIVFSQQWLRTDPESVNAEYNLALGSARRQDFETAVVHYRKATELRPDYAFAFNNLANALTALGRAEEAIPDYQRAAQLDPNYFEAHFNLGLLLCQTGKLAPCTAMLSRAAQLKPDRADVYVNLGNALAMSGDLNGATSAFARALVLAPDSAEAHGNFGNVLASTGKTDEAIAEYREALRLNPGLTDVEKNLQLLLSRK